MLPRFRYPTQMMVALRGLPTLLVGLALVQLSLNWARVLLALLAQWRGGTVPPFWQVPGEVLPTLLASHVTLLLALLLAAVVANLLSDVTVTKEGLILHAWSTTKRLSWEQVHSFFATTVGEPPRDVVFVRVTGGLPLYMRLYGLVVGHGFVPGFLITSDMADFEQLLGHILYEWQDVRGAAPDFVEAPPSPFLAMLGTPRRTIAALSAPLADETRAPTAADLPPLGQAAALMALSALALPVVLGLASVAELRLPWAALILFLVALTEWPLASYGLVVLSDFFPGGGVTFSQAAAVYPYTQLPRWVVALALAFPLLLGAPAWLLLPIVVGGIVWSGYLVAILTAQIYRLTPKQALLGSAVPAVYQLLVYGLLLWSR